MATNPLGTVAPRPGRVHSGRTIRGGADGRCRIDSGWRGCRRLSSTRCGNRVRSAIRRPVIRPAGTGTAVLTVRLAPALTASGLQAGASFVPTLRANGSVDEGWSAGTGASFAPLGGGVPAATPGTVAPLVRPGGQPPSSTRFTVPSDLAADAGTRSQTHHTEVENPATQVVAGGQRSPSTRSSAASASAMSRPTSAPAGTSPSMAPTPCPLG